MTPQILERIFATPAEDPAVISADTGVSTATIAGMRMLGRVVSIQRMLPPSQPQHPHHCRSCTCSH